MSGVWLGVDLRTDTIKICLYRRLDVSAQILLTILGSIVKIIEQGGEGQSATWSFYGSDPFDFEES